MKKCIIWGTGIWGEKIWNALQYFDYEILVYCDNDISKKKIRVNDCPVLSANEVKGICIENEEVEIVVAIKNEKARQQVSDQIRSELGLKNEIKRADEIFDIYFEMMLGDMHKKLVYKWDVKLDDYIENWCNNLMNEVKSWVMTAVNLDNALHWKYDSYRRNRYLNIDGKKELPIQLKEQSVVMDIGCGLFCKYGDLLPDGSKVKLIPVDALAHFYNNINARKRDENRKDYRCFFGLFEFMGNSWDRNYADLIIIGNALDHCIDPYRSLLECLWVLKCGGVIRLVHARAEGLYEEWEGLHKWNCDYIGNDFVLWNNQNAINVTNELNGIADVQLHNYFDIEEDFRREYITVDIIKKTDFELSEWVDTTRDNEQIMRLAANIMNKWAYDSATLNAMVENIRMNE
ncbi:MAG: hypothetical protein IJN64_15645 [Lachnospiraceae bacterium]|nr:hypothetical protein [Lachnospiraceae bacterium]